jgi:DNA-binding XRE family transcriptional regulator
MSDSKAEGSESKRPPPEFADLLAKPEVRARFEQTSAALEAADLVRRMRRQALSASGVRGISQEELAERAGISQPRISQIEKGEGRDGVSYAVLRKIAYACGIDWGHLLRAAIPGRVAAEQQAGAANVPAPHVAAQPEVGAIRQGSAVVGEGGQFGMVEAVLYDEAGVPQAVRIGGFSGLPPMIRDIRDLLFNEDAVDSFLSGSGAGLVSFDQFRAEAYMKSGQICPERVLVAGRTVGPNEQDPPREPSPAGTASPQTKPAG